MTSSTQDRNFLEEVIGARVLEAAMDWIAKEFSPEDVFDEGKLSDWALNNGFKRISEDE
jgi:hypothetical protein